MGDLGKIRGVKGRQGFIDHIQRVEAYLKGADLDELQDDNLPEKWQDTSVAEYAGALHDKFSGMTSPNKDPRTNSEAVSEDDAT